MRDVCVADSAALLACVAVSAAEGTTLLGRVAEVGAATAATLLLLLLLVLAPLSLAANATRAFSCSRVPFARPGMEDCGGVGARSGICCCCWCCWSWCCPIEGAMGW